MAECGFVLDPTTALFNFSGDEAKVVRAAHYLERRLRAEDFGAPGRSLTPRTEELAPYRLPDERGALLLSSAPLLSSMPQNLANP